VQKIYEKLVSMRKMNPELGLVPYFSFHVLAIEKSVCDHSDVWGITTHQICIAAIPTPPQALWMRTD
jgi:hypothetical protein